jgi:hypothetical protein
VTSQITRDEPQKVADEYDLIARQIDERTARPPVGTADTVCSVAA